MGLCCRVVICFHICVGFHAFVGFHISGEKLEFNLSLNMLSNVVGHMSGLKDLIPLISGASG